MWHAPFVTIRLALRLMLPLLAVLGLALTPMAAPAAMAGLHASMEAPARQPHAMSHAAMDHGDMAATAMDEMPCCPRGMPARSDCAKTCLLMALCMAGTVSLPPATIAVPTPVAIRAGLLWPGVPVFASLNGTPQPEPPRA